MVGGDVGAVALDATALEQLAAAILDQLAPQLKSVLDGFEQRLEAQERRLDELSRSVADQRKAGAEIAAQVSSQLLRDLIVAVAGVRGGEVNLEPVVARLDGIADGIRLLSERLPQLVAEQVAKAVGEQLSELVSELKGAVKSISELNSSLSRIEKQLESQGKRLGAVEAGLKVLGEAQGKLAEQVKSASAELVAKQLEQAVVEARRAAEAAARAASQVEALSRRVDSLIEDLAGERGG